MKEITKGSEKKFLLPGGQRFYFKVKDLVSIINGKLVDTINEKKEVSDNDPKAISIEYGVHSVDSLSGFTGQGRGMHGMYFAENRLTKLDDISESLDKAKSTDFICFDTFALGQGGSGAESNAPHDIYNVGFKITIGDTKPICLKSFVVKDKDDNYSLGLYYVGRNGSDWNKDVSDSEYAFPIYWDKEEKNRKINQEDLLQAKVNLQIIAKESLNEISEVKINQSQAIVKHEYINPEAKNMDEITDETKRPENEDKIKKPEKKFLLPGGQRFYFKVRDLLSTINDKKEISNNDLKKLSIEYGVHSVCPLGGQGSRGSDGMCFSESRLTKLPDLSSCFDEAACRGDVICFDTFALGEKDSNELNNTPHDIYNVGFKITIGDTEPICLKSFVVKDEDGNYSLGLYYMGNGDNVENWEKDVSNSEHAFPIYWDKEEQNRKINQEDLLKAKVNLQIIANESPNEINEISKAKINQSQAIVKYEYINPEAKNKGLLYFAESDKYLYKEENVSDGNKIGQNSKIKRVGKIPLLVLIPVLVFLLMFFVIKMPIAYAIIYAVLSIVVEFIVVFVRAKTYNKDNRIYDNPLSGEINNAEMKESISDKIEKSEEYRKDMEHRHGNTEQLGLMVKLVWIIIMMVFI